MDDNDMQHQNVGTNDNNSKSGNHDQSFLRGKVALIIGGQEEGVQTLILSIAERGSDVVIVCLKKAQEQANQTKQMVESLGRKCLLLVGDPNSKQFAQETISEIMSYFGHLDIFIDYTDEVVTEKLVSNGNGHYKNKPVLPHVSFMSTALKQIIAST